MKPLIAVGLAGLLLFPVCASAAEEGGAAEFAATTLTLSASAEVRAPPDLAVVDLGVQAQATSAAAAFAQARAHMVAITAILRTQGVTDDDIQTSGLNLQAQYAEATDRSPRRLTGYEASNTVSIRLHDLSRVGAVVDALVAAGANQVNGVSFQLADATAVEDEARRRAVKALQSEAQLYAQASGYRLQRLVRLSDGGGGYTPSPRPLFLRRAAAMAATPVAAGELTVSATVSATFELGR